MRDFNVLITGCSKHSKGIIDCLKGNSEGVNVKVYGVDCNENNLLREGVDGFCVAPRIDAPNYIDFLIDICNRNNIDVILPYITAELELLSINRRRFEDNGIMVSVTNVSSIVVANNKVEMYHKFYDLMPAQRIATNAAEVNEYASQLGYPQKPLCCKISNGCGGAGFAIIDEEKADDIKLFNKTGVNRYIRLEDLARIADKADIEIILQEYVGGIDYSVCVLADGKKNLHKVGYAGYSMQYGAVISGEVIENKEAYMIADVVTEELGLEGNACFDFIITKDGSAKLLEVNPRINASLPFVQAAGVNMPHYRCVQLLGGIVPSDFPIQYGLKMQKYYESKYFV